MKARSQPKPPPVAQKRGHPYTQEEIEEAIGRKFSAETGQIAIRHLWSDGTMHRFRVNWWEKRV